VIVLDSGCWQQSTRPARPASIVATPVARHPLPALLAPPYVTELLAAKDDPVSDAGALAVGLRAPCRRSSILYKAPNIFL
jgi:hypothetical protein